MRNCKDILKEILESIEGGGRVVTFMDDDIEEIKAALSQQAAPQTAAKMPCGTAVTNVYEAYEAGKRAATQEK